MPPQAGQAAPWAWGPDSVDLLQPLFAKVTGEARAAASVSTTTSPSLTRRPGALRCLRKVLAAAAFEDDGARSPTRKVGHGPSGPTTQSVALHRARNRRRSGHPRRRAQDHRDRPVSRGHHRIVVKEALGLAGSNAIRLWEPEVLRPQCRWMANALENGRRLVIEPWLEREMDFSGAVGDGAAGFEAVRLHRLAQ